MEKKKFYQTDEMDWEDLGGGVSRQIMGYNNDLMMVKVRFEKGAIGSLHDHFHSQSTFVAAGSFEISIENNKQVLHQGDSFFIEPDLPHAAICLEQGILIDVFSPVREDFLNGSKVSYFGTNK
jgi:quercetin dioxygenase-like cupin family protein